MRRIFFILFTILFLTACKKKDVTPTSGNTGGGVSPNSGVQWVIKISDATTTRNSPIFTRYVLENNYLYFTAFTGGVYKMDLDAKKIIWQNDIKNASLTSITSIGNKLFIGICGDTIYVIDKQTGKTINKLANNLIGSGGKLSTNSTTLFFVEGDTLFAMDPNNYTIKWKFPVRANGIVKATDNEVIVATDLDEVYCIDPTQGTQKWKYDAPPYGLGFACSITFEEKIELTPDYVIILNADVQYANDASSVAVLNRATGSKVFFKNIYSYAYYTIEPDKDLIIVTDLDSYKDFIMGIQMSTGDTIFRIEDDNINASYYVFENDIDFIIDSNRNLLLHSYFDGNVILGKKDTLYLHSLSNPQNVVGKLPINGYWLQARSFLYKGEVVCGAIGDDGSYIVGIKY